MVLLRLELRLCCVILATWVFFVRQINEMKQGICLVMERLVSILIFNFSFDRHAKE